MGHTRDLPLVRDFSLFAIGLTSVLAQISVMRQLMAVFSGNELDIGITLSAWLVTVATGSYVGHRIRHPLAFEASFFIVAFIIQPELFLIHNARSFLPFEFGEVISISATIVFTFISLFPVCFVLGLQFPLAVSRSGGNTAKAYGLEAAGACAGGALFSLLLSGRTDVFALSAGISLLNLSAGLLLLKKRAFLVLLMLPFVFFFSTEKGNKALQWKGGELIQRVESRYGEIEVLKTGHQANLYSSGRLIFSYPDPQTEELRAHLAMTIHPRPDRVLVIGGSPAIARECLKYPLSAIDFIEIDPRMIDVSLGLLDEQDRNALRNKRVRVLSGDARPFVKGLSGPQYDLVMLNLPGPATANINRYYTTDFFAEVRAVLRDKGVLSVIVPPSSGYIGRRLRN